MGEQFTPSSDEERRALSATDAVIDRCAVVELSSRKSKRSSLFSCTIVPTSGMCSLALLAVVSLVSCVLLQVVEAKVVEDFDGCKDSLYMGTPPRGFFSHSLRKICQRYGNKPHYVTLYDPRKRIPVYSGYTFKKSDGEMTVDVPWMFEPQVSSQEHDPSSNV